MDYTAIIVAIISLIGVIYQGTRNAKMVKRAEVVDELVETRKQLQLICNGQLYVLQDRLLYLCDKYLDKGYISTTEYKMIVNMYHAYHDLGGNDFITDLFTRVKTLQIKDND